MKASPPPAAAKAEVQSKAKSVNMIRLTTSQAVNAPAQNAESRGRPAEDRVFHEEHGDQPRAGRSEDFQDRRVGEPGAAVGRERPGEHQDGRRQRDAGRGADRQRELGDEPLDRLERVTHPHGRDGRKVTGGGAQERDFLVGSVRRGSAAETSSLNGAPLKVFGE